ncbi:hypothetical protein CKAH01_01292 [Colletotrichum kahawae]|uniref:Uncharacterized protein n=1 Tax=Colletotrichum kahawae TaxID=34407 RepID=A0AAD9YCX0_COLKA|nr:hypothetical protein CKAH01_01292 [Colletotrichum kahawae]
MAGSGGHSREGEWKSGIEVVEEQPLDDGRMDCEEDWRRMAVVHVRGMSVFAGSGRLQQRSRREAWQPNIAMHLKQRDTAGKMQRLKSGPREGSMPMGYRQELRGRGANGIARGQGAREESEMHEASARRLWLGWHRAGRVDGLDHLDALRPLLAQMPDAALHALSPNRVSVSGQGPEPPSRRSTTATSV